MKRFILTCSLLGWAVIQLLGQNLNKLPQVANQVSSSSIENTTIAVQADSHRARYQAVQIPQNGLVWEHVRNYRFNESTRLEKLPQEAFDILRSLDKGTIAIEFSNDALSPNLQILLSCCSKNNNEYFGICTNELDHFGVSMRYPDPNNSGTNVMGYYSGDHLSANSRQMIVITFDPNGKNVISQGVGAYSFFADGKRQHTAEVKNVKHFMNFKNVKDADGIYLGGVQSKTLDKEKAFNGTIHAIYVWNRTLAKREARDLTREIRPSGNLVFQTTGNDYPYRIPALTQASNGDLIAVADLRIDQGDIGNGQINLRCNISPDNGFTWLGSRTLKVGTKNEPYSDAAIVADPTSEEVLVLCGSGTVPYPNSVKPDGSDALKVMRIRSHDNGQTWGTPENITAQFTSPLSALNVRKVFIASGRITQSQIYKYGSHHRLYCVALVKNNSNQEFNAAFYSDDFGQNWKLLGDTSVMPIPTGAGANEAKAVELPDGSVLISARNTTQSNSGRIFNILNYTNPKTGEGFWSKHAYSNKNNQGIVCGNSTNGDILCVPVIRRIDSRPMYLLLQSLPFGSGSNDGRTEVGIYYKALNDLGYFNLPQNVAKNWEGKFPVVTHESAYSVMELLNDHTVAMLYEDGLDVPKEGLFDVKIWGYDIKYRNYSIETITGGAYIYNDQPDRTAFVEQNINSKYEMLNEPGRYVGQMTNTTPELRGRVDNAVADYSGAPSDQRYHGINAAVKYALDHTFKLEIIPGHVYRMINKQSGFELASAAEADVNVRAQNIKDIEHFFTFVDAGNGEYYLQHMNRQWYVGALQSSIGRSYQTMTTSLTGEAGRFKIVSGLDGNSTLECTNAVETFADYKYLSQETAEEQSRLIAWKPDQDWIHWNIEPVYTYEAKLNGPVDGSYWSSLYLPFAVSIPESAEGYIGTIDLPNNCMRLNQVADVESENGFILVGAAKNLTLPIVYETTADVSTNEFGGTLTDMTVDYLDYYTLGNGSAGMGLYHPRRNKGDNVYARIPANKAYVIKPVANLRFLSFGFDTSLTDIDEVETETHETETQPAVYYDLSGRRVAHPTHGIYILNGRKVYIK